MPLSFTNFTAKLGWLEYLSDYEYLFEIGGVQATKNYSTRSGPPGYKTSFMLNSAEHKIYHAYKC